MVITMPLDKEDWDRLKEVFVTRKDCDMTTSEINAKLTSDYAELAVIKSQLKTIIWILSAVGSGIIAILVKMFFKV